MARLPIVRSTGGASACSSCANVRFREREKTTQKYGHRGRKTKRPYNNARWAINGRETNKQGTEKIYIIINKNRNVQKPVRGSPKRFHQKCDRRILRQNTSEHRPEFRLAPPSSLSLTVPRRRPGPVVHEVALSARRIDPCLPALHQGDAFGWRSTHARGQAEPRRKDRFVIACWHVGWRVSADSGRRILLALSRIPRNG